MSEDGFLFRIGIVCTSAWAASARPLHLVMRFPPPPPRSASTSITTASAMNKSSFSISCHGATINGRIRLLHRRRVHAVVLTCTSGSFPPFALNIPLPPTHYPSPPPQSPPPLPPRSLGNCYERKRHVHAEVSKCTRVLSCVSKCTTRCQRVH